MFQILAFILSDGNKLGRWTDLHPKIAGLLLLNISLDQVKFVKLENGGFLFPNSVTKLKGERRDSSSDRGVVEKCCQLRIALTNLQILVKSARRNAEYLFRLGSYPREMRYELHVSGMAFVIVINICINGFGGVRRQKELNVYWLI